MTAPTEWPKLSLPYGLHEDTRLAANLLVRCAVFSTLDFTGGAQRPEITEPLKLPAIKPYCIAQVGGVRLSQTDADLFFWLLARTYRFGTPKAEACVYFKRSEVLSGLKRTRGGKTDDLLGDSLQRLCHAAFVYEMPTVSGHLKLLSSVECFDDTEKQYDYKVTVSRSVADLLADGEWLTLRGKVNEQLAHDPLAKGLCAFYTSHKSAYPMWSATLKKLMGRESMQDSKWRHALNAALAKVQGTTGWIQCELVKEGPSAGKVVVLKGGWARARRRPAKPVKAIEEPQSSAPR